VKTYPGKRFPRLSLRRFTFSSFVPRASAVREVYTTILTAFPLE
jgi:hypothetical protein